MDNKKLAKKLLATTKEIYNELYELEKAICIEPNKNLKVYQNIRELDNLILITLGVHENYVYKNYNIFDLSHYLVKNGVNLKIYTHLEDYLYKYYNDIISEDEVINFYSQDVFSVYGLDNKEG